MSLAGSPERVAVACILGPGGQVFVQSKAEEALRHLECNMALEQVDVVERFAHGGRGAQPVAVPFFVGLRPVRPNGPARSLSVTILSWSSASDGSMRSSSARSRARGCSCCATEANCRLTSGDRASFMNLVL